MTKETNNISKSPVDESSHDEHSFDGIKELNNPAPNWIIFVFLLTYGFSLVYAINYFGYPDNGKDQISEYKSRMATVEQEKKQNQSSNISGVVMTKEETLAAGAKLFAQKGCIACHGTKGEGNAIGPNLTDHYWINGCKQENLIVMISEGKPEKGMTPFKTMMSPEQIRTVAVYIMEGLVGSNPENAKQPQGVICNP